jgi:hypothetical protein
MSGDLFPRNQLLFRKGRPFGTGRDSVFRHCLGCSFETMKCADYTLGIVKTVSMSGLGGNSAGCGADEKPFGGAADTAQDGAASNDAQSVVAFACE